MSARDRFEVNITCPNCQQAGVLHLSEDDHPYMRSLHRAVDSVDGDFKAEATEGAKVKLICNPCGTPFDYR